MFNISILKSPILKKCVLNTKKFINKDVFSNSKNLYYKKTDVLESLELVGKGAEGSVYKIKDSNLALKVRNGANINKELTNSIDMTVDDLSKINHVKAKVGENIEIMEFIDGKSISSSIDQNEFSISSIKDCIKYIYDASLKGFRHDFGGKNVLFDSKTKNLVPIDFLQSRAGYKDDIVNNTFIQLYPAAKDANDVKKILSKVSIAFLELLKENSITDKGVKKLSVSLKTVKDMTKTTPELAELTPYVVDLEKKLQNLATQKSMSGFMKDINGSYNSSLEKLIMELKKDL